MKPLKPLRRPEQDEIGEIAELIQGKIALLPRPWQISLYGWAIAYRIRAGIVPSDTDATMLRMTFPTIFTALTTLCGDDSLKGKADEIGQSYLGVVLTWSDPAQAGKRNKIHPELLEKSDELLRLYSIFPLTLKIVLRSFAIVTLFKAGYGLCYAERRFLTRSEIFVEMMLDAIAASGDGGGPDQSSQEAG